MHYEKRIFHGRFAKHRGGYQIVVPVHCAQFVGTAVKIRAVPDGLTRSRPISQHDVAAACGLSGMTVSRAMRGKAGVSAQTQERVLAAARELGYVPNRIAGALAGAKVPLIAVIVPGLSNMMFPEVLMGLSAGLEGSGYQTVLGISNYDPATEERVLQDLLAWRPAAVVLTGLHHTEHTRAALTRAAIPVIEIMDSDGHAIDCVVGLSQRAAGRAMGRAVVDMGRRKIVLLGSARLGDQRQRNRFEGFSEAVSMAGVQVIGTLSYTGHSSVAVGRDLASAALHRWPDLDFIYCTNDLIAMGALFALKATGRNVPEQIGLAGFAGLDILDGLSVRIATTDTRRFEIGQQAAAMMLARLAGAPPGLCKQITPTIRAGDTL